jgi:hypothetical protein
VRDTKDIVNSRTIGAAAAVVSVLALGSTSGCSAPAENAPREASVRKAAPIPVCTTQLAPVKSASHGKAVVRSLDPEQWVSVLVPTFTEDKGLSPTDIDCTGHYVFANEMLRGGISSRGWPRVVEPEEVELRSGPDGMRVVWIRALKFENGDEGGPIALVRAVDDRAEVYGIGSFRGPPKAQMNPVRLGNDNLVVAESKACPTADDCQHKAHFYLPRRGRLIEAATVDLERTAVVPSVTARGLYAQYRLSTDVTYKPDGIHLLEQVKVKIIHYDQGNRDSDRELRKVEFSRLLRVQRDTLFSSNDPLWERVVGQD